MAENRSEDVPSKATEMGPIFWISIGLGTVASLPMFSGIANGTVTIARGAMWFLITTLVAMVGVWTIAWLMHVFSDPYPGDGRDEDDDAPETGAPARDTGFAPAATDLGDGPRADAVAPSDDVAAEPALSEAP